MDGHFLLPRAQVALVPHGARAHSKPSTVAQQVHARAPAPYVTTPKRQTGTRTRRTLGTRRSRAPDAHCFLSLSHSPRSYHLSCSRTRTLLQNDETGGHKAAAG